MKALEAPLYLLDWHVREIGMTLNLLRIRFGCNYGTTREVCWTLEEP